jgi:transcriptional regulator with XRE-family HTH domain
MKHKTITMDGKRYVVVDETAFVKPDAPGDLPAFPPVDANGNSPAIEYARVSIARQIITERRAAGLTQSELATRAGVRVETISRLEGAKHSADEATMKKIDRVLRTIGRTKKDSGGKNIASVNVGDVVIEFNYATRATRTLIPVALAKSDISPKA